MVGVTAASFLTGCSKPETSSTTAQPHMPPPEIKVTHPHRGEIWRTVTLPANVLAYQDATLYAKVAGYLKTLTVDKGDPVKEGQLLAEIEVPELIADQARCKAEVEVAALDYQRVQEAKAKAPDLVVPQAVDNARARLDVAKAALERNATLLGFARISAPFSGMITRRWVDPGAFIPAATSGGSPQSAALLTLMDFSKVRVQVAVPELEVPFITNSLPVRVKVEELPNRNFDGSVTRFANVLDDATKTMLTEIEMANPQNLLRPGMYALAQIGVERRTNALLVPAEALVVEKSKRSVFTVIDGKAKKVAVKTGFANDGAVEILEGIQDNELIALPGKVALSDGQAVSPVEAK